MTTRPEMTTDTPSTSGEGVDVLRVMQQCSDALCTHEHVSLAVMNNGAIRRIAALIEASFELTVHGDGRGYFESGAACERFRKALAACRATQGAHP